MVSTTTKDVFLQPYENDVDYSPWQRNKLPSAFGRERSQHSSAQPAHPAHPSSRNTLIPPEQSNYNVVTDPFWGLRKECSTRCHHLNKFLSKPPEVIKKERRKVKDGVLLYLKVQIKEKTFFLQESKQRYLQLIHENIKLQDEISSFEKEMYSDVKSLLENHRKYRDGLKVLTSHHSCAITRHQHDLEFTEKRIHLASKILREQIKSLDKNIEEEKHSMKILLNYKEKEYPEQLERIKTLNEEIVLLDQYHNDVIQELQQIADTKKSSYQFKTGEVFENVKWNFADEAMRKLDPAIKKLAVQNKTMKKEISIHLEDEKRKTNEITQLQRDIHNLKQAEKKRLRVRRKYFLEKCPSDEDISFKMP